MNCWEFMKCGREEGGFRANELGVCPAYPDKGQSCARAAGTLCEGEVQGSVAQKIPSCIDCDFYNSEHYQKPIPESMETWTPGMIKAHLNLIEQS